MMTVSEVDLRKQLEGLDWGTGNAAPAVEQKSSPRKGEKVSPTAGEVGDALGALDGLDVAVAGVKPARVRKARTVRVKRQPNAQALLDAVKDGQTVAASTPAQPGSRRPRTAAPDVLVQAGEGPAVIALFDAMWKDVGSRLARSIGRAKASRQDAAIGWYALLLAMRERDAKK